MMSVCTHLCVDTGVQCPQRQKGALDRLPLQIQLVSLLGKMLDYSSWSSKRVECVLLLMNLLSSPTSVL